LSCFTGGGSIVIIPLLVYGNLLVKNFKWRYFLANSIVVIGFFFFLSPGRKIQILPIDQFFFFLNFLGNPFNAINSILFGWFFLFLLSFALFVAIKTKVKLQSTLIFQQILGFNFAMGVFSALSRIDGGRSYGSGPTTNQVVEDLGKIKSGTPLIPPTKIPANPPMDDAEYKLLKSARDAKNNPTTPTEDIISTLQEKMKDATEKIKKAAKKLKRDDK
jgi:hypothetical protein